MIDQIYRDHKWFFSADEFLKEDLGPHEPVIITPETFYGNIWPRVRAQGNRAAGCMTEQDKLWFMEDARAKRLWKLYRLTPEEYDQIFEHQGGVCAITGEPPKGQRLSIDHDHTSGELRGLLSPWVNKGLAFFQDSPVLLRAAADYLENYPVRQALGKRKFGLIGKAQPKKKMIYGSLYGPINDD